MLHGSSYLATIFAIIIGQHAVSSLHKTMSVGLYYYTLPSYIEYYGCPVVLNQQLLSVDVYSHGFLK